MKPPNGVTEETLRRPEDRGTFDGKSGDGELAPAAFPAPRSAAGLMDEPEPEIEWLSEGLLPAGGNIVIAGYPKSYKTFFIQELAVSLTSMTPFLDRFPVDKEHNVGIIFTEDMAWRAARRTRRLCRAHGVNPRLVGERIHFWHRPPLQLTPAIVGGLAQRVKELEIDVLFLDHWSSVATGNWNDAADVTPQLNALSSVRDVAPDCTAALTLHARKTKDGDASRVTDVIRGSSAFAAWYDAGIVLARKDEQSPVAVRCELRDYPSPDSFTFTVEDEYPASEANGWRSSGYLKLTADDRSIEHIERDQRVEKVVPLVREFVAANDGCSKRALRQGVNTRGTDVDLAWKQLEQTGEGTDSAPPGGFKAAQLHLCVPVSHSVPDVGESQRVPVSLPRRGGQDAQTVAQNPTADVLTQGTT